MKRPCSDKMPHSHAKRCIWTETEDKLLLKLTKKGRNVDWAEIAKAVAKTGPKTEPQKTAKQCRERWHNRINPTIKTESWSHKEEALFFELHRKHGPKWSEIALELPGRTDNTIKNFFYCKLRKMARRIKKGIISDEIKSSSKEVEHSIYLINHLKTYYVPEEKQKNQHPEDKYVAEMARTSTLTLKKIDEYLKEYLVSVKTHSQNHGDKVSETDDSLTKIHQSSSDALPSLTTCFSPHLTFPRTILL